MEQLSTGILNRIISGETINDPIFLQYVGSKCINNDKYRLWLSDGEIVTSYAFGHSNDLELIRNGILTNFSLCKINNYVLTKSKGLVTPVIMIRNIEVVTSGGEIGNLLGKPIMYEPKALNIKEQIPVVEEVQVNHVNSQPSSSQNVIATVPIIHLSPYYGKWTIRARVSAKSNIKTWNNARGEGRLFSIDLIDESGEIKCTGFNDQVHSFYDQFEVGCIYYITKCQVKPANKRFTTIKHEFELVLNADTATMKYEGDDLHIPMIQFDFSPISDIQYRESGIAIDILAIIKTVGEVIRFKSKKTGADLMKRDILLVDDSNTMITLTLWDTQADEFNEIEGTALAIKAVAIKDYNGGKFLSTTSTTIIQANPAISEIERIQTWFNETERAKNAKMLSTTSTSLSSNFPWLNFKQVEEQNIGVIGTDNIFLTKATIGSMKHYNALYKACPTEGCNKKLLDPINCMYRCVKCNADFPNFTYRMICQATLLDYNQELKVTIFHNEVEQILNKSAQEIGNIYENFSTDIYENIFHSCQFKSFIFKILMKQEHFNNISRVKAVVLSVSPINLSEYSSRLMKEIKKIMEKPST